MSEQEGTAQQSLDSGIRVSHRSDSGRTVEVILPPTNPPDLRRVSHLFQQLQALTEVDARCFDFTKTGAEDRLIMCCRRTRAAQKNADATRRVISAMENDMLSFDSFQSDPLVSNERKAAAYRMLDEEPLWTQSDVEGAKSELEKYTLDAASWEWIRSRLMQEVGKRSQWLMSQWEKLEARIASESYPELRTSSEEIIFDFRGRVRRARARARQSTDR